MNHIEIKHLRMVRAIAATGNMTRAAENLCLSQSALSQQLKDIEGKLKVDLFFRARKKMILTPTGRKLLDTAEQVTRMVEDTELEISRTVSGDSGELKVGVQCLFCYKWLPRVMGDFQKKYPNIELVIGMSEDLTEDLEGRKFDFIITAAPASDEQFTYIPLFVDEMVCVLPSDHPLSSQSYIRVTDFDKFNLISHADRGNNRFYQSVLKPRGVEPKRFLAVGQPQAMVEMVATGFGISIFPAWAVREALATEKITARPLTAEGLPLTWHAVYLPLGQMPLFQEEFIRIIGKMNIKSGLTTTACAEAVR